MVNKFVKKLYIFIDGRNKLSQALKQGFESKESLNEYKRNFIITEKDEHKNYNTNEFKKELLLSKLMNEKIPENNTIKKYLEKDKVDFTIKVEDKEEIFWECFKDINNTISQEARDKMKNKKRPQKKNTYNKEEKNEVKYDIKDNSIIYDLCHNLLDIDDVKNALNVK